MNKPSLIISLNETIHIGDSAGIAIRGPLRGPRLGSLDVAGRRGSSHLLETTSFSCCLGCKIRFPAFLLNLFCYPTSSLARESFGVGDLNRLFHQSLILHGYENPRETRQDPFSSMFTPIHTSLGALLLFQGSSGLLFHNGAVFGISSLISGSVFNPSRDNVPIVVGLVSSVLPVYLLVPTLIPNYPAAPHTLASAAATLGVGFLLGWGTKVRKK